MQTNLKAHKDRLTPPDFAGFLKKGLHLLVLISVLGGEALTIISCEDIMLGSEDLKKETDTPPEIPSKPTPEEEIPETEGANIPPGNPQPDKISPVVPNGYGTYAEKVADAAAAYDFTIYTPQQQHGFKFKLDQYIALYQEAHDGQAPERLTFTLSGLQGAAATDLVLGLLDTVGAGQNDPDDAHSLYKQLGAADLARCYVTRTDNPDGSVSFTIDLTEHDSANPRIGSANIMTDDTGLISGTNVGADGALRFDVQARAADSDDWAFAGIYINDGFTAPASGVFSYALSGALHPGFEDDAGYWLIISRGDPDDLDYEELVYNPSEYSDSSASAQNVPLARFHEKYFSVRDAEVEALGSNDLRVSFAGRDSRVTVEDVSASPFKFILNQDSSANMSYLKFKVKKYAGFSKEEFLDKVSAGVKVKDGINNDAVYCEFNVQNFMNYVSVADAGAYYEIGLPLLFMKLISRDIEYVLDGVSFTYAAVDAGEYEIADIVVEAAGQGSRQLAMDKIDRAAGFTGFGVALDNARDLPGMRLSGVIVNGQELKAEEHILNGAIRAFTLSAGHLTGEITGRITFDSAMEP